MKKIKFLLIGIIIFTAWLGKVGFINAEEYFEVNTPSIEFSGSGQKKVMITVKNKEGVTMKYFFQSLQGNLPLELSTDNVVYLKLDFKSSDNNQPQEDNLKIVAYKSNNAVEEKEIKIRTSSGGKIDFESQYTSKTISGLVPCGGYIDLGEGKLSQPDCNLCYLFLMLNNIMDFMVKMVGVVGVIFIVVGGLILMASGGNENLHKQGWSIIRNTLVGVVIVLAAWVLINTILTITGFARVNLGLDDVKNGNWFELTCNLIPSTGVGDEIPPEKEEEKEEEKKEEEVPPIISGKVPMECTPCGNASGGWSSNECLAAVETAVKGYREEDQAQVAASVSAIMRRESGANLKAEHPKGEDYGCGPMQMKPSTAKLVAGQPISCGRLKTAESVGWGAEYLKMIGENVKKNGFWDTYRRKDGNKFDVMELIAAGYIGGFGANFKSADCGPGNRCNNEPLAGFKALVPKWYCPYDFEGGKCVKNEGEKSYQHTREVYTKIVPQYYNEYLSCLQKNATKK